MNLSYVIKRKVRSSISKEQRPNSSIYFMTTKPVTFKSIYASKWSYNLINTFGMLLISGGIIFIVKSIIGGFGESHYTTLVYAAGNTNDNLFFSNVDHVNFFFESLLTTAESKKWSSYHGSNLPFDLLIQFER